ncbi:sulfurtransferase TusA family protein [Enterovibrio nigricans]|uniref:TusA-related sulfurtransferase n=1 Tax=Enterovibrio nigricans DSM 22720 TaxID=1121868 RepID=A0A1T4UNM0_9GAMM|nr:sulfurtransferase TusA family protein [Enterovibrio nigricans]PKF50620.1 sulfurtransferase TusA family protein [Enterovibrio nigricans]SKA54200.1 TusA-related sulfurtransferase [Enterovibrio nigricans DSM 22720]
MEIQSLDLREQRCPMALLLAKRACASLEQGQRIALYVTDAGALRDIPRYLLQHGYLVEHQELEGTMVLNVTKL